MKKDELKPGLRVAYPETLLNGAGIGTIDKDVNGNLIFHSKDENQVFVALVGAGSLFFPIDQLTVV